MVQINNPPNVAPNNLKPVFFQLPSKTRLKRVYKAKSGRNETTFRFYGPLHRFDHHQPLTQKEMNSGSKGKTDPDRGVNYWGYTLECCIIEVFGDTRVITSKDRAINRLASIEIPDPINLLDLRGRGAMRVGTNAAIAKIGSRIMTQAWSRYFYQEQIFKNIEGIIYENAHNSDDTIMFYERAKLKLLTSKVTSIALDNPQLQTAIQHVASQNLITYI